MPEDESDSTETIGHDNVEIDLSIGTEDEQRLKALVAQNIDQLNYSNEYIEGRQRFWAELRDDRDNSVDEISVSEYLARHPDILQENSTLNIDTRPIGPMWDQQVREANEQELGLLSKMR